ncbi:hypothetical protein MJT46_017901 [Ovis ammon polii x Ovis aries]|nr:hypothetical protein MJT46_017901 [Ovis ammon polii x Ovis aries]
MRIAEPEPARRGRHCWEAFVRAWLAPAAGPAPGAPSLGVIGSGIRALITFSRLGRDGRRRLRRQGAEPPAAPFVCAGGHWKISLQGLTGLLKLLELVCLLTVVPEENKPLVTLQLKDCKEVQPSSWRTESRMPSQDATLSQEGNTEKEMNVGSQTVMSQIRNQSHVSSIGRQVLYHGATREAPGHQLYKPEVITQLEQEEQWMMGRVSPPDTHPGDQSHIMSVVRSSVHAKWIVGKVIGTAMQKTAKVRVTRLVLDPYLLKYFNKRKTYFAHDALQQCSIGDIVLLKALPVPRTKHVKHELAEIVFKVGQVVDPVTGKRCAGTTYLESPVDLETTPLAKNLEELSLSTTQ